MIAVCDSLLSLCTWLLLSPFFGVFCLFALLLLVLFLCLDEDCNPGWGDCGRPLRLCWLYYWRWWMITFCSLATGLSGRTALGAKKDSRCKILLHIGTQCWWTQEHVHDWISEPSFGRGPRSPSGLRFFDTDLQEHRSSSCSFSFPGSCGFLSFRFWSVH